MDPEKGAGRGRAEHMNWRSSRICNNIAATQVQIREGSRAALARWA